MPVPAVAGVTAIDTRVADVTVMTAVLAKPPALARIVARPTVRALTTLLVTDAVRGAFDWKVAEPVNPRSCDRSTCRSR